MLACKCPIITIHLFFKGKFGLQTTNGYSIRDYVLADGSKNKSWKIRHQDLDLTSNHPVFSVHLINQ